MANRPVDRVGNLNLSPLPKGLSITWHWITRRGFNRYPVHAIDTDFRPHVKVAGIDNRLARNPAVVFRLNQKAAANPSSISGKSEQLRGGSCKLVGRTTLLIQKALNRIIAFRRGHAGRVQLVVVAQVVDDGVNLLPTWLLILRDFIKKFL